VKLTRSPARAAWHALSLHESEREREEGDGRRMSLTHPKEKIQRKKSADVWPPMQKKEWKNLVQGRKKRGDSLENEWTLSLQNFGLCIFALFFFFFRGNLLSSPQNQPTHLLNNKNYGRFESQRYARDARARHANRCFRSRNALDRTVLVDRRRETFFIAIERGNFSEKEFDQISLSFVFS